MLDPAIVEQRLSRLVGPACSGDERDIHWIGAFATSLRDPDQLLTSIEETLVYLARYMRQDIAELEKQDLQRLRGWVEITSGFIRAENGKKPDEASELVETEYT